MNFTKQNKPLTAKDRKEVIANTLQNVEDDLVVALLRAYVDGFITNEIVDPYEVINPTQEQPIDPEEVIAEEVGSDDDPDDDATEEQLVEEEIDYPIWFSLYVDALSGYWGVDMLIFHTDADHEPRWPGVVEAVKRYCCNIPSNRSDFTRWLAVIDSARLNAEEITTLPSIKEGSILDNLMKGIVS